MSELEFEVQAASEPPRLTPEDQPAPPPEGAAAAAALLPVVPSWTPEEAAGIVASLFTTATLVAYVARWAQLPDADLWPYLAATRQEFPQMGSGLVPLLDRFLPKGTAGGLAAAGVGLIAGVGEIGIAAARRVPAIKSAPQKSKPNVSPAPAAQPSDAQPSSPPAADEGFRFDRSQLEVIDANQNGRVDPSLAGLGLG